MGTVAILPLLTSWGLCLVTELAHTQLSAQELPAIISFLIFGYKYFKHFSNSIILLIAVK